MSDREISAYMKWRELCEQLKEEAKVAKDGKEAGREEDRGLIAAALTFSDSKDDISSWRKLCMILKEERVKEASQEGTRGLIAALLLLAAKQTD